MPVHQVDVTSFWKMNVFTAVFSFLLTFILVTGNDDVSCGLTADVVFIVDSSRSIWPPYFREELDFVANVSQELNISPDATHVGVVSFSVGVRVEVKLNEFNDDLDQLRRRIKDITFTAGDRTETYEAIRVAREVVFRKENGARPGVPHILIILTDGDSSDRERTFQQANLAREDGIQVFVVGIGHYLNKEELAEMATHDSKDYVYTVSSFSALKLARSSLVQHACRATTTSVPLKMNTTTRYTLPSTMTSHTSSTTQQALFRDETVQVCHSKMADVVFVIDKSNSITPPHFQEQLDFVNDLIHVFDVARDRTHVAVVTFDHTPIVEFSLNQYFSKTRMEQAVRSITYTAGSTNTDLALKLVTSHVLSAEGGARKEVAQVVIVVTDGQSSNPEMTQFWADQLKKGGAYVFAIGVGNETDKLELQAMGSAPSSDFVFKVDGYNALRTIEDLLAFKACGGGQKFNFTKRIQHPVPSSDLFVRCKESQRPADVMFIIDFTHAGGHDVTRTLQLIQDASGGLDISEDKRVRVGLVTNPCPDTQDVELGRSTSPEQFALALTPNSVSKDQLAPLLRRARQKLTSKKDIKRVAVVFVHGPISDLKAAATEVMRAKSPIHNPGVRFLFVGMGGRVSKKEILQLASERNLGEVQFLMEETGKMPITWQDVLGKVCEELES